MQEVAKELRSGQLADLFSEWGNLKLAASLALLESVPSHQDFPTLGLYSSPPPNSQDAVRDLLERFWPGPLFLLQPSDLTASLVCQLAWACPFDVKFRGFIEQWPGQLYAKITGLQRQRYEPTILSLHQDWSSCHRVGFIKPGELRRVLNHPIVLTSHTEPTLWRPTVPGLWLTGPSLQVATRLVSLVKGYLFEVAVCIDRASHELLRELTGQDGLSSLHQWVFDNENYSSELSRQLNVLRTEAQRLGARALIVVAPSQAYIPEGFTPVRAGAPENSI